MFTRCRTNTSHRDAGALSVAACGGESGIRQALAAAVSSDIRIDGYGKYLDMRAQ